MILILSHHGDQHVPLVTRRLEQLGEEYLWFDCARFPVDSEIHVRYEHDGLTRMSLRADGREYDLSAVKATWLRRLRPPRPLEAVHDDVYRTWAAGVCTMVLWRLWEVLDCRWLPASPDIDAYAGNKLLQLAVAGRLGWRVPRTIVTNSPEQFLAFYEECEGRVVTKLIAGASAYAQTRVRDKFPSYTHPVTRRDLASFRSIRFAPIAVQEYVSKQVELRITVVDNQVFAAEIQSQSNPRSRDDWRHHDMDPEMYRPHVLPSDVEARCVDLLRALHLTYGALDVILTPDGEYVFIEINPNGQWAWIEDFTHLPIADAITEYLAHGHTTARGSTHGRIDQHHTRQLVRLGEPVLG
jgi:glutathione synthase/RimK-type ligase-like ATP-grasp enzyme